MGEESDRENEPEGLHGTGLYSSCNRGREHVRRRLAWCSIWQKPTLCFGGEANQSNRCHPTSPLPPGSLDPSSFSSPEEATRLRRSVALPRMLDLRGSCPAFILSSSFPKPSAALATPNPSSLMDRDSSSAVRGDSMRREWEGDSGGSGSRISTHHRSGRDVETLTTGSEGTRWFEVDTKPSKEVSPSHGQ